MVTGIIQKSSFFAASYHAEQKYPGTEFPYLIHLNLVASEVIASFSYTEAKNEDLSLCAALLHDVLEDTNCTFKALSIEFGKEIADGVLALSKNKELPKSEQMRDSLQRLLQQPIEIQKVKLADRITNLSSPPPYWTKEKIKEYREEARVIYETLKHADVYLASRLLSKIQDYAIHLNN